MLVVIYSENERHSPIVQLGIQCMCMNTCMAAQWVQVQYFACTNTIMHCSHTYIITHLNVEVMHPGDINAHAVMSHHWNVIHAIGKIWLELIKAKRQDLKVN